MKLSTLLKILNAMPEDTEFKIIQYDEYTADLILNLPEDRDTVRIANLAFEMGEDFQRKES